MKLDKELVREIMLQIEEDEGDPMGWKDVAFPAWTREQISYHIHLLDEASLIEGQDLSTSNVYDWRAIRLTYAGHELLNTVRDGEVWTKTKEIASKAGVYSLQFLVDVAKSVAKQELVRIGVHLS